jgi:hypothetical protein
VGGSFQHKLSITPYEERKFVRMQLLLCVGTARRVRRKPHHSDLHLRSHREWHAESNDDVVCVAALLKYIESGIGLVGGKRLRKALLIAG